MALKQIETPELRETAKFNLWFSYFNDRNNKECYGNATKSALKVYNTNNYSSAGVIGHENLKKLKNLKLMYMDMQGFGFGERMKISLAKAMKGSYNDWDKFMVRIGEFEDKPQALVQNNYDFSGFKEEMNKSRAERGLPPV